MRAAPAPSRRGTAVVLVRNAVDHDSRVLRVARALGDLGLDTTVLGVVSFTQRSQLSEHDGVLVRRIGPSSRLAWRVYSEISFLSPTRRDRSPSNGAASRPSEAGRMARVRGLSRRVMRWASTIAYYVSTTREVLRLRPDLLHCNDYNTMWVGVAARLVLGAGVVYDSHELWPDRNQRVEPRRWLIACERLFVHVADRVVTTSPAYADTIARRYGVSRPEVVRNVPERSYEADGVQQAEPARETDGAAPPLAIYVGGLQPNRGLEQAIRAMGMLDGVRLRLLGPGAPAYRRQLEHLIAEVGVSDRVEIADPVPPNGVVAALREADLGVALIEPANLSYRLTLPNKLFEYALAGLPVLGSDIPMIAAFVGEHQVGDVVDPADVDAIAARIGELTEPARNAELRAAVRRAASGLDWSQERQALERVYREVLQKRGRGSRATS